MSDRLFISFSGGRTSAYMTHRLLAEKPKSTKAVVLFANTGQEHEETLKFVDRCDRHFGFNVKWLEAVVSPPKGMATTHRVVDFASADREGRPYEEVIRKYGLANPDYPHCTRELKLNPMYSYIHHRLGWEKGSYDIAIGLRADEMDRVDPNYKKKRVRYPLIDWKIEKDDVINWWACQPFDLNLPEHLGNCTWCWKKSPRKLLTLMLECPEVFTFPARMERLYSNAGSGDLRRIFRGEQTVEDLRRRAILEPFEPFNDANHYEMLDLNGLDEPGGGCTESCEIFTDDFIEEEAA